jgi:hypothetical protein
MTRPAAKGLVSTVLQAVLTIVSEGAQEVAERARIGVRYTPTGNGFGLDSSELAVLPLRQRSKRP